MRRLGQSRGDDLDLLGDRGRLRLRLFRLRRLRRRRGDARRRDDDEGRQRKPRQAECIAHSGSVATRANYYHAS